MLLARELGLGGTERQLTETALALDRSEFASHVGCFTAGGFRAHELREAGVPVLEPGGASAGSDAMVIGIVCARRPEKGIELLLEAFVRVRLTHPEARLLIVGSGPMLERLRAAASDACHFEPAMRDVAPWLRTMDV